MAAGFGLFTWGCDWTWNLVKQDLSLELPRTEWSHLRGVEGAGRTRRQIPHSKPSPLNSPGLETSSVLWAGLPLPELCAAAVRGHQRSLAFPAALTPLPISSTHPLLEPRSSLEKRAALVALGEESLASSQGDPQQEPRAQVLMTRDSLP